MASSNFHKAQAEALIILFNEKSAYDKTQGRWDYLINLAQVHATLATIKDDENVR